MQILSDTSSQGSQMSDHRKNKGKVNEKADEFLRNFFIKFGMKKTLESFQTEWYELKSKGELQMDLMP